MEQQVDERSEWPTVECLQSVRSVGCLPREQLSIGALGWAGKSRFSKQPH